MCQAGPGNHLGGQTVSCHPTKQGRRISTQLLLTIFHSLNTKHKQTERCVLVTSGVGLQPGNTVDSLYRGHPCVHGLLSTVDRVSTLGRVMNSLKF